MNQPKNQSIKLSDLSFNFSFITSGAEAGFFSMSGLSMDVLAPIWELADVDKDNRLSKTEFAIAMHIILRLQTRGLKCPSKLPAVLNPAHPAFPQQHSSRAPPLGGDLEGLRDSKSYPSLPGEATGRFVLCAHVCMCGVCVCRETRCADFKCSLTHLVLFFCLFPFIVFVFVFVFVSFCFCFCPFFVFFCFFFWQKGQNP